ncbi:MAG: hypothetical protein AAF518_08565 [Spirochaetota bacterium]
MEVASQKGLQQAEIAILEEYFLSLDIQAKERLQQIPSSEQKESLYRDLQNSNASVAQLVRVLEKLFSPSSLPPLQRLEDMQVGESCGIRVQNRYFLAKVEKTAQGSVSLSLAKSFKSENSTNVSLYVYRTSMGGYRISGQMQKTAEEILFFSEEEFVLQGDEYLMALLEVEVQIRPWFAKQQIPSKSARNPAWEEGFAGKTQKISQRGVLFVLHDSAYEIDTTRQEYWEITFTLARGDLWVSKGRLIRSEILSSAYILRFEGLEEESKKLLYTEILAHDPVKENLS